MSSRVCRTRSVLGPGVAVLLLVLAPAGEGAGAQAPGVSITPVTVTLWPSSPTETVRLRNETEASIRYQITAFSWGQTSEGQQVLEPTEDLIFFPPLITVDPGAEQIIRIASGVPFSTAEKSYRLFIEQLPPPTNPDSAAESAVTLLTQIRLPIFVQPGNVIDGVAIDAMGVTSGTLRFALKNTGNVHFAVFAMRVEGVGSDGATVFERSAQSSYVHAQSALNYALPIPREECLRIDTLRLTVETEQRVPGREFQVQRKETTEELRLTPDSCGGAGNGA